MISLKISNETLKANCRRAVMDGTLAALHGAGGVLLNNAGLRCAIGLSIPLAVLKALPRKAIGITTIEKECSDIRFADIIFARALMVAHDTWAMAIRIKLPELLDVEFLAQKFFNLIDLPDTIIVLIPQHLTSEQPNG